uniref:coiled-coil domain-containing protein 66 isoform X2 n=1 Tax=Doryrhamphus excisus TaxID=161450 RepID=UPI0025ADAE22|nr:coiled-coil domain-containing protein 66 isoform X2 [Doryrhamphus excisus]
MYLGDGLLFELENGKPKLIVLSQGVERNLGKRSAFRSRPASILRSGQPSCMVLPARPARQCTNRPKVAKNKAGEGSSSLDSNAAYERGAASRTASKTREHQTAGGKAKTAPKVQSHRHKCTNISTVSLTTSGNTERTQGNVKAGPKHSNKGQSDTEVGLPGEEVQRILNGVQTSSDDQPTVEEHGVLIPDGHQGGGAMEDRVGWDETKGEETTLISPPKDNRSHGGLFSWLEEREVHTKASVEAKKAQWRRELNEQVALKQQQQDQLTSVRLQLEEDTGSVCSAQLLGRHREQPAAIRSSLRLGAVTPMEELLTVERREEQRRHWLEELDRQREETNERRKREKLLQSQKEDHDLWAAHFDSMHRRPPAATPVPPPVPIGVSKRGDLDLDPSSNLSLAWDAASSCGADSVDRVSVDTSSRYPARSSYLRSMTALLDPVQMEERERRRLKQLEQQKAIEAQVEERRQQRAQEEAKRKAEEEAEERRVMLEWNVLQTKYQEDAHKEQRKEHGRGEGGAKESPQLSVLRQVGRLEEKRDTAVQTEAPPPLREDSAQTTGLPAPPSHIKKQAVRGGKERMCRPEGGGGGVGGGGNQYEAFARTERRNEKRPEWNTQRPSRRFVPASERYPVTLQRNRQESRLKRQEELLTLQERNCQSRSGPPPHHQDTQLPSKASQSKCSKADSNSRNVSAVVSAERGSVPAVAQEAQPPVLEFIPYIRTDEVFNLDPVEPANTPPPHTVSLPSDASHEDLRPGNTQRQQEILKGLAQLRQGLLQKQRQLETDLRRHDDKRLSPSMTE